MLVAYAPKSSKLLTGAKITQSIITQSKLQRHRNNGAEKIDPKCNLNDNKILIISEKHQAD